MQNPLIQKLGSKVVERRLAGDSAATETTTMMMLRNDEKTGGLVTDSHLRVTTTTTVPQTPGAQSGEVGAGDVLPDVFSIGDCAVVEGQRYPATAQVASQQATYLAKRLNKGDLGGATTTTTQAPPFRFRNWGVMTYLGNWRAIHQSSADELTGRAAWFLWRTAYLTKSMSIRNKIMVPVYWFMSWLFGRDISRF
ncbi:hypothetical protein ONZ43_g6847 [Nemania bipapillata]|uniref:Uncharacterized protein n=1 Tax=Nemania bipapillata TaxID=110536 RepID=A0ACC2HVG0_9PEZI|nr:hypothetical protein ONZ43_g6847 [Nemania bipapillata]